MPEQWRLRGWFPVDVSISEPRLQGLHNFLVHTSERSPFQEHGTGTLHERGEPPDEGIARFGLQVAEVSDHYRDIVRKEPGSRACTGALELAVAS